jgi:NAD(P)-dependent dehydrogenase (short-subunit alcohol dehydrogenase family)
VDELRGKVAVVTGAASGIGYALCERFAAEGMRVVMADVAPDRLEAAARRVEEASGVDVLVVPTDVTRWEDVENLAERAYQRFGAVHLLCNNAGVQRDGLAWEFPLEDWEWIVGVNLWGTVYGIKAFVPRMIESGEEGHIVNTASLGGLIAFPRISMYSAAKAGVVGLSESPSASEEGGEISLVTHVRRALASDVAELVVNAVRVGRFWILTHQEYNEQIERRCRGIVETDEVVEASLLS